MKPTEAEFYDRLDRMDQENDDNGYVMIGHLACALAGWGMGLLLGYFIWGM